MALDDFFGTQGAEIPAQRENAQNGAGGLAGQVAEVKRNPGAMFSAMGWKVPQNIWGNPTAILRHLSATGQVTPGQVQQAMRRFGGR